MRLINTETLQFESFADSERPPYTILSHRWGKGEHDEISFEDMKISRAARPAYKSAGYNKLEGFCALTRRLGRGFAWMDTCCIDKTNSTELSEAINSMYRWYLEATTCVAYLQDVDSSIGDTASLEQSVWFTRGWTLQELIAPREVLFYDREWTKIGTKDALLDRLSGITGIPQRILSGAAEPSSCSVAQRMSWAAHRSTERVEDRAYSLMGLFDVSLPMIYGEREKAFLKLQQAIIENSDDESVFTWSLSDTEHPKGYSGLFAPSPNSFSGCGSIIKTTGSLGFQRKNVGLSMSLMTFPYSMNTYYAFLNCTAGEPLANKCAIFLVKLPSQGQYARARNAHGKSVVLMQVPPEGWNFLRREILVRQDPAEAPSNVAYGFWLRTLEPPGHSDCDMTVLSRSQESALDRIQLAPGSCHTAGVVFLRSKKQSSSNWSQLRWMKFGFDQDFNPVCLIANAEVRPHGMNLGLREDRFYAAVDSGPESPAHHALFSNTWMQAKVRAPAQLGHGWADGASLYTFSPGGTDKDWMQVKVVGLNVQIDMRLLPDYSALAGEQKGLQAHLPASNAPEIWVVDITEIGKHSPKWERIQYQCNYWTLCAVSPLFAMLGCGCCVEEFKQQRRAGL
ncbi:hypothetical protein LTR85_004571 [Meristemomyces frigidus]|nr:hypothetical protein LTR85_004571 [Meristemomyces frigidus]